MAAASSLIPGTSKSPHQVVIYEGNIGAGKSTIGGAIATESNGFIKFTGEPVGTYQAYPKDGNPQDRINLLEAFYKDPCRYAHVFQIAASGTKADILLDVLRSEWSEKILSFERSPMTEYNCFAPLLQNLGYMDPWEGAMWRTQIWPGLCGRFQKGLEEALEVRGAPPPECTIVYLRSDPVRCMERVKKRNRVGESLTLPYLRALHDLHENWLNGDFPPRVGHLSGFASIRRVIVDVDEAGGPKAAIPRVLEALGYSGS